MLAFCMVSSVYAVKTMILSEHKAIYEKQKAGKSVKENLDNYKENLEL